MEVAVDAWDNVTRPAGANCFRKAGILSPRDNKDRLLAPDERSPSTEGDQYPDPDLSHAIACMQELHEELAELKVIREVASSEEMLNIAAEGVNETMTFTTKEILHEASRTRCTRCGRRSLRQGCLSKGCEGLLCPKHVVIYFLFDLPTLSVPSLSNSAQRSTEIEILTPCKQI